MQEEKMSVPDLEIIVGTYEEFLLGYKTYKKEDSVSRTKRIQYENGWWDKVKNDVLVTRMFSLIFRVAV